MNPETQFCPNTTCHASGKIEFSNIVIHSRKQHRYKCTCCCKTFSESKGTGVYGLKKPTELFVIVRHTAGPWLAPHKPLWLDLETAVSAPMLETDWIRFLQTSTEADFFCRIVC